MHWIDWSITIVPLFVVLFAGWRVQRYITGVADFMTAGRIAHRYLIAVADGAAALGLISVINMFEQRYVSGYAYEFWANFAVLLGFILTLTGFVNYRYRETRVMTMAQFFELRYSKSFRIFSGFMAFIAGVINYAIFPAVGGRFIIYYCQLPDYFTVFGVQVNMFGFLMAFFLSIALFLVMRGGQLANIVTDCLQGIFAYIGYVGVAAALLFYFSGQQFLETMSMRPVQQSFFNPFDTGNLYDFNVLFVLFAIFGTIYGRMSWQGNQGYYSAGVNPHEQKMGAILGGWRASFNVIMVLIMSFSVYIYMNHPDFAEKAAVMQSEIANRINTGMSAAEIQVTRTLQTQMTVPMVLRQILPVGLTGLFFSMMMFLMISTDTTYLHSWGSIFVQDVILPFRKKAMTPKAHLTLLRLAILGVAIFAWIFSFYFGQVTYIMMFFSLTGAIYAGGAGSAIIGGLYWKKGTAAAAWAAMIVGGAMATGGFLITKFWASHIYPGIMGGNPEIIDGFITCLTWMNANIPIAQWDIANIETKFPITGQEMSFISSISGVITYIIVSILTCREDFNLERMLHRGIYNLEHKVVDISGGEKSKWSLSKFAGISAEYSLKDKIIAWFIFYWAFYIFGIFVVQLALALIFPSLRSNEMFWAKWWLYYTLPQSLLVAVITTIWFSLGSIFDLRKLFIALNDPNRNRASDDGRVVGHVNADDLEKTVFVESLNTEEIEAVEDTEDEGKVLDKLKKK